MEMTTENARLRFFEVNMIVPSMNSLTIPARLQSE